MPSNLSIEIDRNYWLGDLFQNQGWKQVTLFHRLTNIHGGSVSTPVAEVDIVQHPGREGCNAHCEVRFAIRNNIVLRGNEILVDKNIKDLRHPMDVVAPEIIEKAIIEMEKYGLLSLPRAVYVCMRHEETFNVTGDFWNDED